MRILVLSDSHGRNYGMFSVVDKHYSEINAVIHLGDLVSDAEELVRKYPYLPVCTVAGKCDLYGFSKDDYEKTVEYGGVKIFMCHGHTCGVKGSLGLLRSKAEQNGAKIARRRLPSAPAPPASRASGRAHRARPQTAAPRSRRPR